MFLVVGDTRFLVAGTPEFQALGFDESKVMVVDDGALGFLREQQLHGPSVVQASDVHFDYRKSYWDLTRLAQMYYNCTNPANIIRRDVLVAGWLHGSLGGVPYINMCPPENDHGVEDVHFNVVLDAVFVERMYGENGLSTALSLVSCPGNPVSSSSMKFPFADTKFEAGEPSNGRVTYNSWFLPVGDNGLHGELNAWHRDESGSVNKRYIGRGPAPTGWHNPVLRNEVSKPGAVDRNCWFPFDVFDPEQTGTPLRPGDYVVMRGTLWQDSDHGEGVSELSIWDQAETTRGQGGWLELHPVDWVVRVQPPSTNARMSGRSLALCTEDAAASQAPGYISITPEFSAPRRSSRLEVRNVKCSVDQRFTVPHTVIKQECGKAKDAEHVNIDVIVQAGSGSQGRFKGSGLVEWREVDLYDRIWPGFGDAALPPGATVFGNEPWVWRDNDPKPFSGEWAHHSALANGMHQHYFQGSNLSGRALGSRDLLFAHVYLDPNHPPAQVMLQWLAGEGWEHRAFWGADLISWGTSGSASRRYVGRLPFSGEWVRLEVPASSVDLVDRRVRGLAFTLFDGRAVWDHAGARTPIDPANNAAFTSQDVPGAMVGGQTYQVRLRFDNVGGSTWSNAEGYRLGCYGPDSAAWGLNRVPCPDTNPDRPCEFRFSVTAPQHSGLYAFQWRMLQEPEWFGTIAEASIWVKAPVGRATVPDVIEMYVGSAVNKIAAASLKAETSGGGGDANDYVIRTEPEAGKDVVSGSTVHLHLRRGPIP